MRHRNVLWMRATNSAHVLPFFFDSNKIKVGEFLNRYSSRGSLHDLWRNDPLEQRSSVVIVWPNTNKWKTNMCVNHLAQTGGSKVRGVFCVLSNEPVFRFHMSVQSLGMSSLVALNWFWWTVRSTIAFRYTYKFRSQCPNSCTDIDYTDTGIMGSNSSGIVLCPIVCVCSMRCSKRPPSKKYNGIHSPEGIFEVGQRRA